jgi:hypothetical protein
MKSVSRLCDYQVRRGKKVSVCGAQVDSDRSTKFALGALAYEIDLCAEHLPKLEEALAPFVEVAEPADPGFVKVGNATRRVLRGKAAGTQFTEADVRAWLRANGHEVPVAGRIGKQAIAAYQEALDNGLVH